MNHKIVIMEMGFCLAAMFGLAGCGEKVKADPAAGAPPPAQVERELDASTVQVDHPEQFPLATAVEYTAAPRVERDGRGQSGCVAQCAGDFARFRPGGRDRRPPGRRGEKGTASAASPERRCFRGFLGLPQSGGRRTARARAATIAPKSFTIRAPSPPKDLEVAQNAEDKAKVDRRDHRRASARAGSRPGPSHGHRRYLCAGFRSDHRPAGDGLVRRAGSHGRPIRSRFPISPTSGSSAMSMKTICAIVRHGRVRGYPSERLSRIRSSRAGSAISGRFWTRRSARPRCGWRCRIRG